MVGSVDYFNRDIDGQVNIAISDRQPGSSFKVFIYLQAFESGAEDGTRLSPASVVYDVRTAFEDPPNPPYVPENYDRKYHGPVRCGQLSPRRTTSLLSKFWKWWGFETC